MFKYFKTVIFAVTTIAAIAFSTLASAAKIVKSSDNYCTGEYVFLVSDTTGLSDIYLDSTSYNYSLSLLDSGATQTAQSVRLRPIDPSRNASAVLIAIGATSDTARYGESVYYAARKIAAESAEFNYVEIGKKYESHIRIANTGRGPVTIDTVIITPGPYNNLFYLHSEMIIGKKLQPGQVISVPVLFDARYLFGAEQMNYTEWYSIFTSCGDSVGVQAYANAYEDTNIVFTPRALNFGISDINDTVSRQGMLQNNSLQIDLNDLELVTHNPAFTVSRQPTLSLLHCGDKPKKDSNGVVILDGSGFPVMDSTGRTTQVEIRFTPIKAIHYVDTAYLYAGDQIIKKLPLEGYGRSYGVTLVMPDTVRFNHWTSDTIRNQFAVPVTVKSVNAIVGERITPIDSLYVDHLEFGVSYDNNHVKVITCANDRQVDSANCRHNARYISYQTKYLMAGDTVHVLSFRVIGVACETINYSVAILNNASLTPNGRITEVIGDSSIWITNDPSAVNEQPSMNKLFVYPTITNRGHINIVGASTNNNVVVTDMFGRTVVSGNGLDNINTSNLPTGIYNISVKNGNDIKTMRFENLK
jgi:hypothetical protein